MNKIIICLMLVLSTFLVINCYAADTEKEIAIKKYLKMNSMDEAVEEMVASVIQQLPKEFPSSERQRVANHIRKNVRRDVIEIVVIDSLRRHFTTAEINALVSFYSSATGKTIQKKMKLYMSDIVPDMQAEIQRSIKSYVPKEDVMGKAYGGKIAK